MKNINKVITIATLITIITMLLCSTVCAQADECETFELLGVVTGYEDMADCTEYTVTTEDGEMLAFYADKGDFRLGDMVYLTMWNVTDPEVLDVYWVTTLEWDEMFRWLDRIHLLARNACEVKPRRRAHGRGRA